jgi:hypothetical protein
MDALLLPRETVTETELMDDALRGTSLAIAAGRRERDAWQVKTALGVIATLIITLGGGLSGAAASVTPQSSPSALFGVTTYRQLSPTVFIPVEGVTVAGDELATYVVANTSAAFSLLRHLKSAAGYWSVAYPDGCPAHQKLEGESGSGFGALALANCGHAKITLVEWHGANKLGVISILGGPPGFVPREYVGNVAFFFDDLSTGKVIGGFVAGVPTGQVSLSSLGRTSNVKLPVDAISLEHVQKVVQVDL